ncbi:RNA polymerase sigma factor [Pedobacter nyackensis]|uniref:RNA polymerase sigma-70 factor, ECF subfamily n=1 Tax=Pedobacter nyackensis TaxID=475255 RepID=A0A1W2DMC5_9SPHI|nr:RNA polymerase sigma-70 factor [Pedobacter nyackensis]SMC98198.1 RNA polymerase sigma-70 factor, ECF subfamily [Pedobacter nyackensis]
MRNYEHVSDMELVYLLRSGSEAAFAEIYQRYQPLLYNYVYRKLQDKEEARDAVQDVYVNLWKCKDDFPIMTTLSGYLFKATLNKALGIFRHKKITWAHEASFKETTNNTSSTDYMIREKEIKETIQKEIDALPGKMREVFLLRHKDGLSNKQIAATLTLSEHTVATQIKNALRVLRSKLGIVVYLVYLAHLVEK